MSDPSSAPQSSPLACPLSAEILPPNMRKHVDPKAPVPLRMMAAKTLVPLSPSDMISALSVAPYIRAEKVRALAVTSAQRNPLYPDVPTVAESGFKGFEALSWSGLSVAKGTPQPIVDKLQAAINQVMQSDVVRQKYASTGFVVPPAGSQHYTAFIKSELELWTRVIKTAGIKPQ